MVQGESCHMYLMETGSPRDEDTKVNILMIGATGVGKSTMIDGFINYIMGVGVNDNFRFSIVDLYNEEIENAESTVVQILIDVIHVYNNLSLSHGCPKAQLIAA